jgi:hypothetical protein
MFIIKRKGKAFLKKVSDEIRKSFGIKNINSRIFPVTLITGNVKNQQNTILCAYAGFDQKNIAHWASLIFEKPKYQSVGEFPERAITKSIKNAFPDCALLLIEIDTPEKTAGVVKHAFVIPRFINTTIDISVPMEELRKRSRSGLDRIRRWIKAQNLSYETSQSPETQKDFYENMYLPFIMSRYADSSLIIEFSGIFSDTLPSEVFLVKKNEKVVAGAVVRFWENRPSLSFLGVKEGHIEDVKRWNTGAIYYFVINEFQKRGIKMLFIGGSPPFLSNGLLFFKMKLLAQIDHEKPYQPEGCVSFHILKYNDSIRNFLEKNPFVYVKADGKMAVAVWSFSGNEDGTKELENQINQAVRLGLDECHVFGHRSTMGIEKRFSQFPGKKLVFHLVGGWFNS